MSGKPAAAGKDKKERKPNPVITAYLVAFNVISMFGWIGVLAIIAQHYAAGKSYETLYDSVSSTLVFAQTLALLEVVHPILGFVRSGVFSAILQVASRIGVLYGVVLVVPPSRESWAFTLMITAWSFVEIPRYLFYAVNLVGEIPYWLKWIRYSLFYVLYPAGISGELLCMWYGLSYINDNGVFVLSMPNVFNFSYYHIYGIIAAMIIYIPGSPFLFGHMMALRKKALAPAANAAKPKAQ